MYFKAEGEKNTDLSIYKVFQTSLAHAIDTSIACVQQAHKNQANFILELNDQTCFLHNYLYLVLGYFGKQ